MARLRSENIRGTRRAAKKAVANILSGKNAAAIVRKRRQTPKKKIAEKKASTSAAGKKPVRRSAAAATASANPPEAAAASSVGADAESIVETFVQHHCTKGVAEEKALLIQQLDKVIREEAPKLLITDDFFPKTLGYGKYHYQYNSGRQGDWVRIGINVNATSVSLHCCGVTTKGTYVLETFDPKDFGQKVKVGKSCLRFQQASDLNWDTLRKAVRATAKSKTMTHK